MEYYEVTSWDDRANIRGAGQLPVGIIKREDAELAYDGDDSSHFLSFAAARFELLANLDRAIKGLQAAYDKIESMAEADTSRPERRIMSSAAHRRVIPTDEGIDFADEEESS